MTRLASLPRRVVLGGFILSTALAAFAPPVGIARAETAAPADAPELIGFGALTRGGGDGRTLHVTTLADDGPGSLRWAAEQEQGPRIIHFDVGGTIDLSRQIQIGPDITLDGGTAPGGDHPHRRAAAGGGQQRDRARNAPAPGRRSGRCARQSRRAVDRGRLQADPQRADRRQFNQLGG
ncbi:hypothetical protein [Alloyangia mangrovi]|uniref:hypothetical protein n=1 Tax=Alloyangia mangrovi TaxID=1779329 RepID=UPI0021A3D88C|nr:hypothetical protein [Alloyangia mangrovi]